MKHVILFDGECRLCNGSVDFVVRRDPKKHFQFASLQSSIAKKLLKTAQAPRPRPGEETIYLIVGERYFTKSSAALQIARKLRFPWNLLYVGIVVPPFIRNAVYDFVGRHRQKWFGATYTCDARREEEEKDRFLDWEEKTAAS